MATITANIFGKDVKFKALIHLSIEPNVIILGRPVQAHYLMTLGTIQQHLIWNLLFNMTINSIPK